METYCNSIYPSRSKYWLWGLNFKTVHSRGRYHANYMLIHYGGRMGVPMPQFLFYVFLKRVGVLNRCRRYLLFMPGQCSCSGGDNLY